MIYLSLSLFALAALGGLYLVYLKKSGKGIPIPIAMGHGALAATGLITLIIFILTSQYNIMHVVSAVIFVIAALGGFFLFSNHLRKKPIPNNIIAIHALVAVVAFFMLLLAIAQ